MAGLVPAIHVCLAARKTWMPGTSPGMTKEAALSILLTPACIGSVRIPNRIVMPAMTTRTADEEGHVTDDTMAYYLARARGGVGLITVEMASPERVGRHRRREVGIYDDRFLPGLTRLVDAVHRAGSKASIQLGHGGGHTRAAKSHRVARGTRAFADRRAPQESRCGPRDRGSWSDHHALTHPSGVK